MATFNKIINTIQNPKQCSDWRQAVIKEIEKLTGRRLLVYVSDPKKQPDCLLSLEDKTGFSDLIEDIDDGDVDIFINSPGGFAEVTEAIVGILRSKFTSIRFAIPNIAKSAATLLVLSGDEILMDHRSELGPIDPQIEYPAAGGRRREAAEDIIDGFDNAKASLKNEGPSAVPAYVPLLSNYTMGLIQACNNAKNLSIVLATQWLTSFMLKELDKEGIDKIVDSFSHHKKTFSHSRAILIDTCIKEGLKILDLRKENNQFLGSKLWELWCLYEFEFERTQIYKLWENSNNFVLAKQKAQQLQIPLRIPIPQQPGQPAIQVLPTGEHPSKKPQ